MEPNFVSPIDLNQNFGNKTIKIGNEKISIKQPDTNIQKHTNVKKPRGKLHLLQIRS